MREAGFAGRILLIGLISEEANAPCERPPLSKQALTALLKPPPAFFYAETRYAEHGVELLLGTSAVTLDRAARHLVGMTACLCR